MLHTYSSFAPGSWFPQEPMQCLLLKAVSNRLSGSVSSLQPLPEASQEASVSFRFVVLFCLIETGSFYEAQVWNSLCRPRCP